MSAGHEEFEAGHELDRALRAAVTGLSQVMERYARRRQEQSRESAARSREEWLANRDAARQQYLPWTSEGRLEKLHPVAASQKWAAAAAWSGMDPTARFAERDMAARIMQAHGQHPSVLINFTDTSRLPADPAPAAKLLSMNEAYGLAATHAPSWYSIPDEVRPLEVDRPPAGAVEEAFHADWQYYSEAGQLPERSQWEQWAVHVGQADEFASDRWRTEAGVVDEDARDAALARAWDEGRDARVSTEIGEHEAAMHQAGMGRLDDHVPGLTDGPPVDLEATQDHSWHTYLTPGRFDAATADEVATAWRDASTASLTGDVGARKSADRLAAMMRERRGLDPQAMLIDALTEQASVNTEARRNAEDRARRSEEAAQGGVAATSSTSTAAATATAGGSADLVSGDRVIELNEMAAEYYASNLRPGTPAHRKFTERLGADFESGPWVLGATRPGWQNLTNHLRSKGATDGEMVAAGLAEPGKFGVRDIFRDRMMMGVRHHETGELVGFLGRDLSGDPRAPKVRNTAETAAFRKGDHVFGLYEAQPGARLVRVEGPFDALAVTLASEGKAQGVSTMGTAMTDTQANAITEKANGRVWLANDNDEAGQKATEGDFFKLSERGTDVRQVEVPDKDPAKAWETKPALLRSSLAELPQAPTAAETVVERYIRTSPEERVGYTLVDGNRSTVASFDDLIAKVSPYVEDPIDRELLARRGVELDAARGARHEAQRVEAGSRSDADAAASDLAAARAGQVADGATGDGDAGDSTPSTLTDSDPRAQRVEQLEDRSAAAEHQLQLDEGITTDAETAEAKAYDRRDEAQRHQMSEHAESARDASSHGFSQSTQDQLQSAPARREGVQAKVQRGSGVKHTQGRTLRR